MDETGRSRAQTPPGSGAVVPTFELPPPATKRWVTRRKAIVVNAVRSGALSIQEACQRHSLSLEEFLAWQAAIDRHGVPGLRTTRLQVYRDSNIRRPVPARFN